MFHILKILSIIALLDYIIYTYYKKNYNVHITNDCYKYRIIMCYIFWAILSFCIYYEVITLTQNTYIITFLISFLLYLFMNIYNKCNYNNYSYQFMCVDTIFGVFITNILIIIILYIR